MNIGNRETLKHKKFVIQYMQCFWERGCKGNIVPGPWGTGIRGPGIRGPGVT